MRHFVWVMLVGLGLAPIVAAQSPGLPSDTSTAKAPPAPQLLGATFVPVPKTISNTIPPLHKGTGLLINAVDMDSAAAKIGLKQADVVLSYGNTSVKDVKHLANLLWSTPPGENSKFQVYRDGKTVAIPYILKASDLPTAASLIKPSGPPAVNLEVVPLVDDKMKITFIYYAGGSAKLQTLVCEGTVNDIAGQIKSHKSEIPGQVQDLMDVAVERLRTMKR